jgi:hypothetical protein
LTKEAKATNIVQMISLFRFAILFGSPFFEATKQSGAVDGEARTRGYGISQSRKEMGTLLGSGSMGHSVLGRFRTIQAMGHSDSIARSWLGHQLSGWDDFRSASIHSSISLVKSRAIKLRMAGEEGARC